MSYIIELTFIEIIGLFIMFILFIFTIMFATVAFIDANFKCINNEYEEMYLKIMMEKKDNE